MRDDPLRADRRPCCCSAATAARRIAAHAHVLADRPDRRARQRAAVDGEVLAVLDGLRGESLLWTDLDVWRRRLLASPWVRDADAAALAAVDGRSRRVGAAADRHRPHRRPDVSGRRARRDHRRVRAAVRGARSADHRRPVGARPAADAVDRRARAELAARVIDGAAARSRRLRGSVSQIDVSDPHNASVILSGDPAVIQLGDEQFLRGCSRISSSRRRCASASPTSTTSTCGSTSGSTCGRRRQRRSGAGAKPA